MQDCATASDNDRSGGSRGASMAEASGRVSPSTAQTGSALQFFGDLLVEGEDLRSVRDQRVRPEFGIEEMNVGRPLKQTSDSHFCGQNGMPMPFFARSSPATRRSFIFRRALFTKGAPSVSWFCE